MKERPILFSGPMVRALLDGRKTQTRRIAKYPTDHGSKPFPPQWHISLNILREASPAGRPDEMARYVSMRNPDGGKTLGAAAWSPWSIGDRMWVRESWYESPVTGRCEYKADGEVVGWRPRPSIHMPRWASRITLEVTGVRCERLQQISDDDAKAEGATCKVKKSPWGDGIGWSMDWSQLNKYNKFACTGITQVADICLSSPRLAFANYIDKIHGPGSWDDNPWVWVVEFKRVMP